MFKAKFAFVIALFFATPLAAQVVNPGVPVSGSPANNDCAKFVVTGGNVKSITTSGSACGGVLPTIANGHLIANATGGSTAAQDTAPSTWFDQAYCNSIGYIIVRFTSLWTCTQNFPADPVWWGADASGAVDSTAAFTSAFAASKFVRMSPGIFKLITLQSLSIASGKSLSFYGSGKDVTVLNFTASSGLALALADASSSFHIRDFTLATSRVNGGSALTITQSTNVTSPANTVPSDINITIRGFDGPAVSDYWSIGIDVIKASNITYDGTAIFGPQTIAGTGVRIDGASNAFSVVHNFGAGFYDYANTVGIQIGSSNGYVQGLTISNANFDGCIDCISTAGSVAGLGQLSVSNSQFNYLGAGIATFSSIEFLNVSTSLFLPQGNNAYGLELIRNQSCSIVGNSFQGGALTTIIGIYIGTTVNSGCSIVANNFSFITGVGIVLDVPSTGVVVGLNNYYTVSTNVLNSGTGNSVGTATIGLPMAGVVP